MVRVDDETAAPTPEQLANTQEFERPVPGASPESGFETKLDGRKGEEQTQQQAGAQEVSLEKLSPAVIDAIARRAVEYLSEKVVQEIAWEVVPPLAELLIKRQLEEKNS